MNQEQVPYSKRDVANSFGSAAATYNDAAFLQREIADRLLERLDYVKLQPKVVLDLGCGTGYALSKLSKRYKKAQVIGLDIAEPMLSIAKSTNHSWLSPIHYLAADGEQLPLADQSVDLIFSNFALQWYHDLQATFTELRRVLKPGGLLMFTTFGPDTLKELKMAWQQVDNAQHVNDFIDMHDVGDALLRARFAEPVMDAEFIVTEYTKVLTLLKDLKAIGAHNINHSRHHGLTGKQRFQQFIEAYEQFRLDNNKLPATYEVVYGHAWAPTISTVDKSSEAEPQNVIPIKNLGE